MRLETVDRRQAKSRWLASRTREQGGGVRRWSQMVADRDANAQCDEASRWVRRKRIFYTVVGIYLSLSLMWFVIDLLDDSSGYWFYWPMLRTGLGVLITGVVLCGIGGLFGTDWEGREVERYRRRSENEDGGSDARL